MQATERNVDKAVEYVEQLQAGGLTSLCMALEQVCKILSCCIALNAVYLYFTRRCRHLQSRTSLQYIF